MDPFYGVLPGDCFFDAVHKNNSVSGVAAGWLKKVRLQKNAKKYFFSPKMDNIFLQRKKKVKKKKDCGRPTGRNYGYLLDRKQNFFYGQPDAIVTHLLEALHLMHRLQATCNEGPRRPLRAADHRTVIRSINRYQCNCWVRRSTCVISLLTSGPQWSSRSLIK